MPTRGGKGAPSPPPRPRTPERASSLAERPSSPFRASPARLATVIQLQTSVRKLSAAEAQLLSLGATARGGTTPPRGAASPHAGSPVANSPLGPRATALHRRQRAAVRLEVDLLLEELARPTPLKDATSEAMELAEVLLEQPAVYPDGEETRSELIHQWHARAVKYIHSGAHGQGAVFYALVVMAGPTGAPCTVGDVAGAIAAYEGDHTAGSWEAFAHSYVQGLISSLQSMAEKERVKVHRRDAQWTQETERENIERLQAELERLREEEEAEQEERRRQWEADVARVDAERRAEVAKAEAEKQAALREQQQIEAASSARETKRQQKEIEKEILRLKLHIDATHEAEQIAQRQQLAEDIAKKAMQETADRHNAILRRLSGHWSVQGHSQDGACVSEHLLLKWDAKKHELHGEGGDEITLEDGTLDIDRDDLDAFVCDSFLLHQKPDGLHLMFEVEYPGTVSLPASHVGWECVLSFPMSSPGNRRVGNYTPQSPQQLIEQECT